MNVATGVFSSVTTAEEAYNALCAAGFDADDIGLVVCDQTKGTALAADLRRDFKPNDAPNHVIDDDAVYCMWSEDFVNTVRKSDLSDNALNWYRLQLGQGNILEIIDVGDRMDDVDRIIHEHGGTLFIDQRGPLL